MLRLDPALQEALLGRPLREVLDAGDGRALRGSRLLVTGAAGSVGAELCRQLAACGAARVGLMDHSEYALFRTESELRQAWPQVEFVPVLGDVTRAVDMRAACDTLGPAVVYHAAAYKHVTYAERAAVQALRVNALGAASAARAAQACGARFVLISSDKAAEPRSVMGATKRFAELVVLGMAAPAFRPIVVRFGNILGSSGSVAEILLERAAAGLPLPITDPDATRYFMTAAEAVALVLKADAIARRSEVFWLDMGAPIRIGDLVARIAAYAAGRGHAPRGIDVIGLRPGEKRHEELTTQGLAMRRTAHPRISSARQRPVDADVVRQALLGARRACARGDGAAALAALSSLVRDFVPSDAARAAVRPRGSRAVRDRAA